MGYAQVSHALGINTVQGWKECEFAVLQQPFIHGCMLRGFEEHKGC
jgi:hypothetical protein